MSKTNLASTLEEKLTALYTMPNSPGGHDLLHVQRMVDMGPRIKDVTGLRFDLDEYTAAVWLHNIDRGAAVKAVGKLISLELLVRAMLQETAFSYEAKERIIGAVLEHSKKDDEPGDSTLLQALRIADKLDRLGPLGIVSAAAFRGSELPLYDPKYPFGYTSTAEGKTLKTVYIDFFRIMEWVGMLPSDQARNLINRQDLTAFIDYVRAFGREVSRRCGVENDIEADIKKALGPYYEEYAKPKALSHVVVIKFKDDASTDDKQKIFDRYQTIAEECGGEEAGILYFNVSYNLDQRKNWHLVEVSWFRDNNALQAFRVHPKHKELTDLLSKIADWVVGDTLIEVPRF